ncbi:hypothetical protein Ciccas_008672 [Cichlidogyrus casuarinus]|uniref:C2H2-type domain-containing protein n=1 Tax=Cichlidogyrus casuarinus TaxID=1844966 RepID=A0ABD2PZM9_9PLAT
MRMHKHIYDFVCPVCQKAFTSRDYLKRHIQTHSKPAKNSSRTGEETTVNGRSNSRVKSSGVHVCLFCSDRPVFPDTAAYRKHLATMHPKDRTSIAAKPEPQPQAFPSSVPRPAPPSQGAGGGYLVYNQNGFSDPSGGYFEAGMPSNWGTTWTYTGSTVEPGFSFTRLLTEDEPATPDPQSFGSYS